MIIRLKLRPHLSCPNPSPRCPARLASPTTPSSSFSTPLSLSLTLSAQALIDALSKCLRLNLLKYLVSITAQQCANPWYCREKVAQLVQKLISTQCASCARAGVQLATARTPRRHFRSRAHQPFSLQCAHCPLCAHQAMCNVQCAMCTPLCAH